MSKSRSGAPRRVAAGLLAGSLAVLGLAFAPPAGATADATGRTVAGATRYGTAAAVATEAYPGGTNCVLIATGEGFADALAASGLAGKDGCPILLVMQDSIPDETSAAIDELGATSATIVGGTAAVSQNVEDSLANDLGLTVDRVAGTDRYETAGEVATAIGDTSGVVLIASGEVAPDALSLGPIAANLGVPILLVTTDGLPSATSDGLAGATEVLIAGGTARVSDANQSDIEDASSDADGAERLAGNNRQETSVEVATYETDTLGWNPDTVLLAAPSAPNDDFSPDALVAGPLGGIDQAPVLIVTDADTLGPVGDFIDANSDTIAEVIGIGGTAVISQNLIDDAVAAAQTTDNDVAATAVDAPQLTTVDFVSADATNLKVLYRFNFDEDILASPIVGSGFHVYSQDLLRASASSVRIDPDNANAVLAAFDFGSPALNPAVIEPQVATVERNVVQDSDGQTNPQGSVHGIFAISNPSGTGNTRAPDLKTVSIIDATTVDYTFDSAVAAVNLGAGGFQLITQAAGDVTPVSTPGTAFAIQGTGFDAITVRVTFASTANAVRGSISTAAVAGVYGTTNPIETEPVAGTSGLTANPDLVSVSFDDVNNRVTYTFDENIDTLGTLGSRTTFRIYFRDGSQLSSLDADRTDSRTVVAQFRDDSVNQLTVGATAMPGSVCRTGAATRCNFTDEIGRSVTYTAGTDFSPELVGFRTGNTTDIFGTATGDFVDFVFDKPVSLLTTPATGFFLFNADGDAQQLSCGAGLAVRATTGTTENAMTIRCSVATPSTPTAAQAADHAAITNAVIAGVSYQAVQTRDAIKTGTAGAPSTGTDVKYPNHEASKGEAPAAA